jgi:hypothetical protein
VWTLVSFDRSQVGPESWQLNAKSSGVNQERIPSRSSRIRPEEKTTEWAIKYDARIVGLACVDMQLNQASGGDGGESIETFEGERSIGGGSVSWPVKRW